jgi:hypothetical protein
MARHYAKRTEERAAGLDPARWILIDSKASDRKAKRDGFDLTRDFVEGLIARGCMYCGETALRMTLDRIDNDKGHTKENVNPACIRCNYLRRDMPYAAWLLLCPALRQARERGAFGDWQCRAR